MALDINPSAQTALLQQQVTSQGPNAANQGDATRPLQQLPDNVVTAAPESESSNVRDDDGARQQEAPLRGRALPSIQELNYRGISARFNLHSTGNYVVLEILGADDVVIARIPSDGLLEFLENQANRQFAAPAPVSRSI